MPHITLYTGYAAPQPSLPAGDVIRVQCTNEDVYIDGVLWSGVKGYINTPGGCAAACDPSAGKPAMRHELLWGVPGTRWTAAAERWHALHQHAWRGSRCIRITAVRAFGIKLLLFA